MSTTTNQQFEGKTIEEALAAAVDVLGDDLEILDAQKVRRRRLLGVRRKEKFEVVASKRDLAEPRDFEAVLKRMVDRVDDAERRVVAPPAAAEREWWSSADFVVPDQPDRKRPKRVDLTARASSDREIEVDVRSEPATSSTTSASIAEQARALAAQHATVGIGIGGAGGDPGPVGRPSAGSGGPIEPVAAPRIEEDPGIVVEDDTPAWSREALLELDLPPALVNRIDHEHLEGDLEWIAATARAVGELLETAESMSGPCELTGHGAESAVHLIRGACDGFRLDSLIIDGRRVPASPLELTLALRALLRESV